MASAAEQQQQTTLEFYQAMADFKNMFPQMDDDVIEAVLRSNQGAVDTTIDQLLAMSTDNENEKIRSELEQSEDSPNSPKIDPANVQKSISKWNEDFLNTLESDSKVPRGNRSSDVQEGHDDEDLFRERLRNMGKVSRRKFAQLTKVFTRSKKRSGRQLLPPTASCDDLLDPEESSRPQT